MAKILVVDDEKMICEEFKEILEEDGHQVDMALNGLDAITKVQESEYDIIFLDVLMPRMEGREAFDRIQKIRPTPVVIMSGYLPSNRENDIIRMGAIACLKKPLDLNRVKELIQSASKP